MKIALVPALALALFIYVLFVYSHLHSLSTLWR